MMFKKTVEPECVSEPIWTLCGREICLLPIGNRTPVPRSSIPLRNLYTKWGNSDPKAISDLHYFNIAVMWLMSYGNLVRGYKYVGGTFSVRLQNRRTFTLQTETMSCFDTLLSSYETVVSHKTTVCTLNTVKTMNSIFWRFADRASQYIYLSI